MPQSILLSPVNIKVALVFRETSEETSQKMFGEPVASVPMSQGFVHQ